MCKADLIALRSNNGELKTIKFNLKQGPCITVLDLKRRAVKEFPKSGPNETKLRLIVLDMPLDNDTTPLCRCGIKPGSVVQMVRKVDGG